MRSWHVWYDKLQEPWRFLVLLGLFGIPYLFFSTPAPVLTWYCLVLFSRLLYFQGPKGGTHV